MGIIEIEGMQFYAFHGHYETERVVGNNFEVYLRFEADCTKASISDNLSDTTNYQEVYNLVKKEMQNTSHLLEHVVQRILNSLFENFPEIKNAQVKISKINPPMGGEIEKVSVTLSQKTK
ncbi:dihydroneopterin aldolase [Maribellus comscasis]|uniref:7,8-dihydroneopterin aldolase n=1 Tax=Maribellus comscasis TaxID=2681766 RepID=A0A6I6JQN5_9BACT|nr:dihydroneopterin aldolase [Maribellus comscasis]QGY43350.1 dihydroneopterin aldolase [Maribellus comscasis]